MTLADSLNVCITYAGRGPRSEVLAPDIGGRLRAAAVPDGDELAQGSALHRRQIRHQRYRQVNIPIYKS